MNGPVITSLPELVTTIAAVRRGALQPLVGLKNSSVATRFGTLFLTIADIGYAGDGSVLPMPSGAANISYLARNAC